MELVWPSDEVVFQQLEKDPSVKRRFEEASKEELQAGWEREGKVVGVVDGDVDKEREKREREVGEMLRKRRDGEAEAVDGGDVDRVLSRGFGDVKVS